MHRGGIEDLCLMAVASGTLALVITRSSLTKSMRHAMIGAPLKLDELFNCPWCMGFWTALPAAIAIGGPVGAIIINWLIITGLSGLYMGFMMKLWLFREDELEEMRELLREAKNEITRLGAQR
jgi:hypothetical protein